MGRFCLSENRVQLKTSSIGL